MPKPISFLIPGSCNYHTPTFQHLRLIAIHAQSNRTATSEPPALDMGQVHAVQRSIIICKAIIDFLAEATGVKQDNLLAPTRGKRHVARTRQLGMYLAHTVFRLSMSAVAKGFGRDRTTVLYACHLIEDLRENRQVDVTISLFEQAVVQPLQIEGEIDD